MTLEKLKYSIGVKFIKIKRLKGFIREKSRSGIGDDDMGEGWCNRVRMFVATPCRALFSMSSHVPLFPVPSSLFVSCK